MWTWLASLLGGPVITGLISAYKAKLDAANSQDRIAADLAAKEIEAAKKWIHTIVAEPVVGEIYEGTVVKTADFGAFVNFFGPKDGLVHISQLSSERVSKTTDVVKEGDKVFVKLMGFDERGKVRLSMKVVDQKTGKEIVREKTNQEWQALLDEAEVPNAPMQSIDAVLAHPQTAALGMMQESPERRITLLGLPLSFDGVRPALSQLPNGGTGAAGSGLPGAPRGGAQG